MNFEQQYPKKAGEINFDRPNLTMYSTIDKIIEKMPDDAIFVESGCYVGGTTKFVVKKLLESGKDFKYYAIDNWLLGNMSNKPDGDFLDIYKDNIRDVIDYVEIIRSHSLDAVDKFADNSVFCCLLDDSHTYKHLKKQIPMWLPKMLDISFLLGDDYYDDGVKRAFGEYFDKKDIVTVGGGAGCMISNPKVVSKHNQNKND